MMQTPVSASPARIARSTGAAPRQRGSSEKWTFTNPSGTAVKSDSGSSCPNATTTPTSAPLAATVVGDLARPFGREDPQPELLGGRLHRAGFRRAAAPAAPIGLGDDERDLVAGAVQRAERRDRVAGVPK